MKKNKAQGSAQGSALRLLSECEALLWGELVQFS